MSLLSKHLGSWVCPHFFSAPFCNFAFSIILHQAARRVGLSWTGGSRAPLPPGPPDRSHDPWWSDNRPLPSAQAHPAASPCHSWSLPAPSLSLCVEGDPVPPRETHQSRVRTLLGRGVPSTRRAGRRGCEDPSPAAPLRPPQCLDDKGLTVTTIGQELSPRLVQRVERKVSHIVSPKGRTDQRQRQPARKGPGSPLSTTAAGMADSRRGRQKTRDDSPHCAPFSSPRHRPQLSATVSIRFRENRTPGEGSAAHCAPASPPHPPTPGVPLSIGPHGVSGVGRPGLGLVPLSYDKLSSGGSPPPPSRSLGPSRPTSSPLSPPGSPSRCQSALPSTSDQGALPACCGSMFRGCSGRIECNLQEKFQKVKGSNILLAAKGKQTQNPARNFLPGAVGRGAAGVGGAGSSGSQACTWGFLGRGTGWAANLHSPIHSSPSLCRYGPPLPAGPRAILGPSRKETECPANPKPHRSAPPHLSPTIQARQES